jgi:hypothetical protein
MLDLLLTDFIKNRFIRHAALSSLSLELITLGSINHTIVLFGLPYCSSVGLNYLFNRHKIEQKAYISAQYKPRKMYAKRKG